VARVNSQVMRKFVFILLLASILATVLVLLHLEMINEQRCKELPKQKQEIETDILPFPHKKKNWK